MLTATVHDGSDPGRQRWEEELVGADVPLPVQHRAAWRPALGSECEWIVLVRDESQRCVFGCVCQLRPTRALPGHVIVRCERFGAGGNVAAHAAALRAITAAVRGSRLVLRAEIDVFHPERPKRLNAAAVAQVEGLRRRGAPLHYTHTPVIDLTPTTDDILASFRPTARRHIRAAGKQGLVVRPIDDARAASQLQALLRDTMARTGGPRQGPPWRSIINCCNEHPHLARLVGLYRDANAPADEPVAFALGLSHGDHVEYATAASVRDPSIRFPMGYALAWDLMRWAREIGARWFDFGGVNLDDLGDAPTSTRGIAEFKRNFGGQIVDVREEWTYEPYVLKSLAARTLRAAARGLRLW